MNKKLKFNISVFTIFCVVLLVIAIILFVTFRSYLSTNKDTLGIISNIFTIAAFLGVILALIDYKNRAYEAKKQALLALRYQLEVIGVWSDYNGTGYHKSEQSETIKKNITNWGNPFSEVFKTDATAIQTITSNPGYIKLPEAILKDISELNQEIQTFNNHVEGINLFRLTGNQDLKIKIHLKLNGQLKGALTDEEDRFSRKLTELYAGLHFDFIGDDVNQRLHYKHKILLNLVKAELDNI